MTGEPDAAKDLDRLDLGLSFAESGKYYTDTTSLRAWWLYTILEGGHPLREKLTLFWHNHFATSVAKVRNHEAHVRAERHPAQARSLGRFRPFLLEMSKDPAMLIWLDSNSNVKGGRTRTTPAS